MEEKRAIGRATRQSAAERGRPAMKLRPLPLYRTPARSISNMAEMSIRHRQGARCPKNVAATAVKVIKVKIRRTCICCLFFCCVKSFQQRPQEEEQQLKLWNSLLGIHFNPCCLVVYRRPKPLSFSIVSSSSSTDFGCGRFHNKHVVVRRHVFFSFLPNRPSNA